MKTLYHLKLNKQAIGHAKLALLPAAPERVFKIERESATLLTMCATMGLKAGCITRVLINRHVQEDIDCTLVESVESKVIRVAVDAGKRLIG